MPAARATAEPVAALVAQHATLPPATAPPPTAVPATAPPTAPPIPTATPCAAAGRVEEARFPSPISGFERRYRIYLPPCYGLTARSYPTLYVLHGNSRGDEEWDVLGIDEAADRLILSGEIAPLLIVMPNGSGIADFTSGGAYSYEGVIVDELLPTIEATFCADSRPAHRAIGGISRGGYWAAEIAFRFPERFASVGIHSGAFVDSSHDVTINPLYTATRNELGDLRIRFDYGSSDWYRASALQLHERMTAAGIAHEWHADNSGGHDDSYWQSQVEHYLRWYTHYWSQNPDDYPNCLQ